VEPFDLSTDHSHIVLVWSLLKYAAGSLGAIDSPVCEHVMASSRSLQSVTALGCLLAGLSVAAGAFGAHMLKNMLEPPMLAVFETAARYQMYHSLGMVAAGVAGRAFDCPGVARAGWCFAAGMLLFCGSLYGVSLLGIRWLGAITPIGGLAFITGWSLLGWSVWRGTVVSQE
jgi:uncharacterized membrane protein YgdD (TMEM256/DUF423 family)